MLRFYDFAQKKAVLKKAKAFSIAEAFIMLTIVSVALAAAAPMITKQIKHNNYSNVQANIISQQLDRVTTQNNTRLENMENTIEEITERMENRLTNTIPSGAVMYFDLATCPSGWTPLANKYPNAANAFIRNQTGSGRSIGNYQSSAVPDLRGQVGNFETRDDNTHTGVFADSTVAGNWLGGGGGGNFIRVIFRASAVSSVYNPSVNEVRPNNITLLACRKN